MFRPKIMPLFPYGTNLADFFTRSAAYLIDNIVIFTLRYIVWIAFCYLWFYASIENFYQDFKHTFSYTLSKPLQQFEYYEMLRYFYRHPFFLDLVFVLSFIFILGAVYYITMHSMYQQTLGKRLLKVKLLDSKKDTPLPMFRVVLRYFLGLVPWLLMVIVMLLSLIHQYRFATAFFVITVLWYDPLLFGRDRRAMHDYLCFSKVIKLKRKDS